MGVVGLDRVLVEGVALVFLELNYFWDISEEDLNLLIDSRLILLNYVHLVQILILWSATDII